MTKEELHKIIKQGEGYFTEFKRNVNSDLKREMVSFANASGGKIFIGVEDDGSISGIEISNELLSKVQAAANDCDPPITISTQKIGENVLLINVKEGQTKPYRSTNGFYMRNGANAQKMRTDDILEFIEQEGRIRFDEQVRKDVDYKKHFSEKKWQNFARLARIDTSQNPDFILKSLGAAKEIDKNNYFTNAGILLFVDTPVYFVPQSSIACVLYKGNEIVHIIDRKEFDDDIISNINDTISFLKRHINISAKIEGLYRKDVWEIPEIALREAVVNAVVHRNYLEKGARILVEIFDNRISISNPGGLPKGLEPKDFGKYSVTRNAVLASILLRTELIEKLGTGIKRINNALTDAQLSNANFEFSRFFSVVFYKNANLKTVAKSSEKGSEKSSEKGSEKSSEKIIKFIKLNNKITITELAEKIAISTRAVEKQITNLKEKGVIERIGADKGGHWIVVHNEEIIKKGSEKSSEKGSEKSSEKIIKFIKLNNKITITELAEKIAISTRAVEKQITNLKEKGVIERIGADKGGYWKIIK